MAKDVKETKDVKDEIKEAQKLLLTEEEYAKRERAKVKERINRVTRVAGLFAILILVYAGILDPLFELSYFGWIWDKIAKTNDFTVGWAALKKGLPIIIGESGETYILQILDDPFQFGPWIAQLGVTILLIAVVVLLVYFITYCIVDLIDLIKTFIAAGRDITKDLSGNVKDTLPVVEKSEKKKKEPKEKKLFDEGIPEELDKKPKKERKRKELIRNEDESLTGLTSEQLDALLSGKTLEEMPQSDNNELPNVDNSEGTKSLF